MATARYKFRYWFEWKGSCLWTDNDDARARYGYEVDINALPLSEDTKASIRETIGWHDTALNWEYPPDPSPWRQDECDRFNAHALGLLDKIRRELGNEYEIINCQNPLTEDPRLNED